jgi:aldehyde:ferredoxin oxidoreductase
MQRSGINSIEVAVGIIRLRALHEQNVLGPGKKLDTDLPFHKLDEKEFAEKLIKQIKAREGIGKDLHKGVARVAMKWGRLNEDLESGILPLQYWKYYEFETLERRTSLYDQAQNKFTIPPKCFH